MKLWKVILGILGFIGGLFAVKSLKNQDKKEFDNKVKENEEQVKAVQEKAAQAEAERIRLKKEKSKAKKKTAATKAQVKDITSAKQTAENFEQKYRKKPGRPKKNA